LAHDLDLTITVAARDCCSQTIEQDLRFVSVIEQVLYGRTQLFRRMKSA
jgi:hypothetical protein